MMEIRLMKTRWGVLIAALLAVIALLIAVAVYAGGMIGSTLDGRRDRTKAEQEMTWFELREQMFSGQADTRVNGWLSMVEAEEVAIKAKRGDLSATYYAPVGMRDDAPWAVVLHGGIGTDRLQVRDIACGLSLEGFHVLTPDLYAHGRSEGSVVSLGLCDAQDVMTCVQWVLGRDGNAEIVLFGQDEGGVACLLAGADGLPPAVRAIAVDSVYQSVEERAEQIAGEVLGEMTGMKKSLLGAAYTVIHGERPEEGELTRRIQAYPLPLLIIHGTGDTDVPAWHGEDLMLAAGEKAQLFLVEGAAHGMGRFLEPGEYHDMLHAFFRDAVSAVK